MQGRSAHERGAAVIRDELKKIGLTVDVAGMEGNALVNRLGSAQGYEAALFQLQITDIDPATQTPLWLTPGQFHVWNLNSKTPAAWEKQIDELMARQVSTMDEAERKRIFVEVQKIFAEHQPIVYFAAPKIFVAASARTMNLTPAVLRPQLLWSADTIGIRR
jgi:ABC-type transport system substrate-binding protein